MTRYETHPKRFLAMALSLASVLPGLARANESVEAKECYFVFNHEPGFNGENGPDSGGGPSAARIADTPAGKLLKSFMDGRAGEPPIKTFYFHNYSNAGADGKTSGGFKSNEELPPFFPRGTSDAPLSEREKQALVDKYLRYVLKGEYNPAEKVEIFKVPKPEDMNFRIQKLSDQMPFIFSKPFLTGEKAGEHQEFRINSATKGLRTSYILENGSDLAFVGMSRFSRETAPAETSVLILGDGHRGNMLKTLKGRGFKNVRSVDVMYIEGFAEALDRSEVTKQKARELRELMAAHPNEVIGADASDLTAQFKSGTQKYIFGKDLFEKMDRKTMQGILAESLRLLDRNGNARFSFNNATLAEIVLWVGLNEKELKEGGFVTQIVPPRNSDPKTPDGSFILNITKTGKSLAKDDGRPGTSAEDSANAITNTLKLHPVTDAMLAFFASMPENSSFSKKAILAAIKDGELFKIFFDRKSFAYSAKQKRLQFEVFLQIYFPNFNLSPMSYDYLLVKTAFEKFVLGPLESGKLNLALHGLELFRQVAQITNVFRVASPTAAATLGIIIDFGTLPAARHDQLYFSGSTLDSGYRLHLKGLLDRER